MKSAINYFIKYPIAADVILILLSLIGLISLFGLTKSQFPTLPSNIIIIEGKMIGASPTEMERAFAYKVEKEIKSVQNIKKTHSKSQESSCVITVETNTKADINKVLSDIKNAVDKINSFPNDLEEPVIYIRDKKDIAAEFVIYGETDLKTLKYYAQKAETDLLNFEGIAEIKLAGFPEEEIIIAVREYDLNKYRLTFNDIANAVSNTNIDLTAGDLVIDNTEVTIRAKGKKFTAQELENIVIRTTDAGGLILLSNVADISKKWSDSPNRNYFNNKKSASVTVYTTVNEDIIEASEFTKEYISKFNKSNEIIKAEITTDGSILIGQRIDLLVKNGIMGMVLIIIILGLFLNIRLAFWVALSIPVSALGMFILAPYFGVNVNIFSLFGLILVIGILVDDGVVIAENIYEKYEKGMPASKAALEGLTEVLPPIVVALTTTMVFFSVFFFIEGKIGGFVSQIGFIVIATLMISLIQAFFILPAHIAHSKALKRGNKPMKVQMVLDKSIKKFRDKVFAPILNYSLNNKLLAFSVPLVLFILSIAMLIGGQAKMTFFPYIDEDVVNITVTMPSGTTENETKKVLDRIEKASKYVNDSIKSERQDGNEIILSYIKKTGPKGNDGTLSLSLLDGETRNLASADIASAIRKQTGIIYNVESIKFGNSSLFGDAISISLVGDNLNEIREASQFLVNQLKNKPELKDIISSDLQTDNDLNIKLKAKAKSLGFTLREITQQLRNGYLGLEAQSLQIGQDEVKIYVKYADEETKSYGKLEDIKIRKDRNQYPIKELVYFEKSANTLSINHLNGKKRISVKAELVNSKGSVSEALTDINQNIITVIAEKYPDINIVYEGQSETSAETGKSVSKVMPIILLLAFFMIVINFRSFKQATVVLILIPFTFTGIVLGHLIHGEPISVLSFYGIIAVAGVVINDSLVLVSRMNQYLKEGMLFKDAVLKAGVSRFRAIVLTSITTIAGLAPLILETSLQAKFLVPMAISMAYGLAIATFNTLILLPVFLKATNGANKLLYRIWEGETKEDEFFEPVIQEKKAFEKLEE